ncbi:MAG: hypothetical protein NTY53_15005 [Kiritimatiellaeota bacterium]|nr:hypothetical protein [Kiritimatiellota bacterium]
MIRTSRHAVSLALAAASLALLPAWAAPKQPVPARKLEALCAKPNLWAMTPDEFGHAAHSLGFAWTDTQLNGALATGDGLEFAGLKAVEARATFEGGKLVSLQVMLYGRAESGAINPFQFDEKLDAAKKALAAWAGSAPQTLPDIAGPARSKIQHVAWINAPTRIELEWSALKPQIMEGKKLDFRADFIRLHLTPSAAAVAATTTAAAKPHTAAELKARLKRDANGDVVLGDVPMVAMTSKSNPLSVTAERVLRYYGLNFDQYQIGQVSDTLATTTGNNVSGLRDSLKKISQKFGLRLVVLQDIEIRDFQRLVQDYNHVATAAHLSKVTLEASGNDVCRLYWNMDLETLRTARAKRNVDFARFKTEVTKSIDTGVPLIWHVMMGKVPEKDLNVTGSCVFLPRLIIGYNAKTGELLLTDGFGAGHELKRMKWEDAWAIGLSLYVIKPANLP